jgi:pSer/pThr/pTyr-binding forkhead associated (FHA) protein
MAAYGAGEALEGPRVVAVGGPHLGQVFPLDSEVMTMGREPSMLIPLTADTSASRRHASVQYANGAWSVRDEGSSNGTWVNGVRVQTQPLFPGAVIRVGQTELRFEF